MTIIIILPFTAILLDIAQAYYIAYNVVGFSLKFNILKNSPILHMGMILLVLWYDQTP